MKQQGRCVLPADETGRVLDRLTALEKVISPTVIRQALLETGRVNPRACKLTHEVMMWVILAMGIFTNLPIRQVFKQARRLQAGADSPCRSALCIARQRLGVEPVRRLFERVVRPLATPETPGAFYRGLRLVAVDGTLIDVPDTAANDAAFGRPTAGRRGAGAFPQIRKLSLVEVGTHVEFALCTGSYRTGEKTLSPQLLPHLQPGMLLLCDRGFFSYNLWKSVVSQGVHVLARLSKGMILKPIKHLSDGSYLAKIYANAHDRKKDRGGILVRVIKYTLDDPQRVGHQEEHVLLTDLLDEIEYPARELIPGYHWRWEHELVFDEQKTHQDPPRAGKPTHLRSETPTGVLQEIYALSLAHFVIRSLMFQAAQRAGQDTARLSFTGCFHILRCRMPECDCRTPRLFEAWCEKLLDEMSRERIEPRRNRINPRVIKRKMKNWLKKRPEHRHLPPLKQTFMESVVMTN
ncbi:MAG: IS4 family transposase [Planctomycetaceae bacterium]|nr:MAG: IS4 family transposase [Planctomycetaceae bacterium]